MIGDRASIHYRGYADGTLFCDTHVQGKPTEFIVGSGSLLPDIERVVSDMQIGETVVVDIPPERAYGLYDEALIEAVPEDELPNSESLPLDKYVVFETAGARIRVKVLKKEEGFIYLDHNHELAGKSLRFEVTLEGVKVESAIERELHPAGCACGCDRLKGALSN